jgi:hypothetical protein
MENRYDYGQFADSGRAEVLRYARENPDDPATDSAWMETPDEYAVGFPDGYRQAAGGLDLQYGYDENGDIDTGACAATLIDTGDKLRDNPSLADRLAAGGPSAVHGIQVTPLPLVRPQNEPPFGSWSSISTIISRTRPSRAMSATSRYGAPAKARRTTRHWKRSCRSTRRTQASKSTCRFARKAAATAPAATANRT